MGAGLTLAKEYWNTYGNRLLDAAEALEPGLSLRLSAGLAGEGSQCLGYDDPISRDHDFGPGFCLWMNDEDFRAYGPALQRVYEELPSSFRGFTRQNIQARHRLGVMSVSRFYDALTGIPQDTQDWLFLSESALACAVSGEIWLDGCPQFKEVRQMLAGFYPEDVRRKKIAARAAVMAQAGQYNLHRCLKRGDRLAAQLAAARFAEAAISMVHLLMYRYTPFYKWAFRSLQELAHESSLAAGSAAELMKLAELWILEGEEAAVEALRITETICRLTAEELRKQGLSCSGSDFLQNHLDGIMSGIEDPQIRAMAPMADPVV